MSLLFARRRVNDVGDSVHIDSLTDRLRQEIPTVLVFRSYSTVLEAFEITRAPCAAALGAKRGGVASLGFSSAKTVAPGVIPTLCLLSGFLKPIRQDVLGKDEVHGHCKRGLIPDVNGEDSPGLSSCDRVLVAIRKSSVPWRDESTAAFARVQRCPRGILSITVKRKNPSTQMSGTCLTHGNLGAEFHRKGLGALRDKSAFPGSGFLKKLH